jgi:2-polyprenyl-6-methoxyphenol hydroxylase-like FAD-dependent oxidoreductase
MVLAAAHRRRSADDDVRLLPRFDPLPPVSRTALVVGAGIGGLAAGISLRRAGWDVRVFERAASPRELGFGVALAPNAIEALAALGVADAVVGRGFTPRRGEVRRMDGTVLKRAELPSGRALGGRTVMALRPALHGALLDAIGLDAIALSREAAAFSFEGRRVSLHLAGGERVDGDLLVGADGVHSAVRRTLHPHDPPPRPSGIVAVRGAAHGAIAHLRGLDAVYYLGPGVESAFVRAGETGIYWFLSLARELVPPDLRDPAAIVARLVPRFDDTFRRITDATTETRVDELVDRDPIPAWGRGVVTLLGDAAHPLLPHTGQGAAQALVDAVTLGQRLGGAADVEPALRAYEQERQPKTAALLRQGRRTARVMRTTNPVACFLRDVAVRLIPVTPLVKLLVTINRRAGTDVTRR